MAAQRTIQNGPLLKYIIIHHVHLMFWTSYMYQYLLYIATCSATDRSLSASPLHATSSDIFCLKISCRVNLVCYYPY